MKKKILIISNCTMGLYLFRKELIAALTETGWQVVVSSPVDGFPDELKLLGITFIETKISRRGANPIKDFALLRRYRAILRELSPDAILTYTIKPNIYGNLAAKNLNIPVISTITGLGEAFINNNAVSRIVKLLYQMAFSNTSCVVFQNGEDEEIMRRAGIIKEQKIIKTSGSGVNLEEYPACGMPESAPVRFLYSGRLMKNKGTVELLDAATRLHREYSGGFALLLAGYFDDELEPAVRAAEDKGVQHLGFVTDMAPLLKSCHCIVLPSYKEGMSNALLEAAATGRPLIASNVSGCREIVDDGVNGFLCKPRDADSLYGCMKRFLALSPEQRAEMGAASRRKVEAQFDRRGVVNTMLELITKVV